MAPVEDLVRPCDERVAGVVVLGQVAGLVEVAEPPEGFQGAVIVVGGVEAMDLLEGLPAGFEAGVGVDGRLVGPRSVADHHRDALAPSVALLHQER